MTDNTPKRRSTDKPTPPTDIDEDQIPLFEEPRLERWQWFARSAGFFVYIALVGWIFWKAIYNLFAGE